MKFFWIRSSERLVEKLFRNTYKIKNYVKSWSTTIEHGVLCKSTSKSLKCKILYLDSGKENFQDSFTFSTFIHQYVVSKAKLLYYTALTNQKCCKIRIFKNSNEGSALMSGLVWFGSCLNSDEDAYPRIKVVPTYWKIKFLNHLIVWEILGNSIERRRREKNFWLCIWKYHI